MFEKIKLPNDLKRMDLNELNILCKDIRKNIVCNVSKNGGHLSSNLGVVELTVILHYLFDFPNDKLLFDVTHQCYAHKILSGRSLKNLRKIDGISGFYNVEESEYDCYCSGHSSTSISTSIGMAVARDIKRENNEIIAVIGDASIANGVALEGLNHLFDLNNKIIVVLNDNGMSISKSVGGISKFLENLKIRDNSKKIGNIDYLGVIDGHNLEDLSIALKKAKDNKRSIIVHVKTVKGYGCDGISCDSKWHGVDKFDLDTLKTKDSKFCLNDIVCDYLKKNAIKNNLCVISPAMKDGCKLNSFFDEFPSRSFDVGINEEHAFVFSNGLSLNGIIPYISVYSTFMQRSYDFINQDLIRNKSKCVIGVERVGLVGEDGASHHGIFDVALVNHLPNTMICMPIYANDIEQLLDICFEYDYLSFIRLCKQKCVVSNKERKIEKFKWSYLYKNNGKKVVLSVGPISHELVNEIKKRKLNIDVIGVNFIKPIDKEMLLCIKDKYEEIFVYDIYSIKEGLYYPILDFYNGYNIKINFYGLENKFYNHGKYEDLLREYKLDVNSFLDNIKY